MNKQDFINFVEKDAKLKYIKDSYGNYKATTSKGTVIRYKIQPTSVRHEKQLSFEYNGKTTNEWHKMWSEYYKNLEINPETGMLRRIKKD